MATRSSLSRILPAMSAIFVDAMSFALITPMIVAAFTEGVFVADSPAAHRELMLGLAFALFPLGMFFGAALLGDLSDRWGRKRTLMTCMAGLLAAFMLMALSVAWQQIELLLLARVLSGFMSGTTAIGTAAIIDLSSEEDKPANIARITLANISAHIIGPGVGGLLADYHLQWPFLMIGLLALTSLVWLALGLRETHTPSVKALDWLSPLRCFANAFRCPNIRHISLVQLLTQLGNCMCYQFFFLWLAQRMNYSPAELGWFSASAMGFPAILMLCVGTDWLQKQLSAQRLTAISLLLTGLLAWGFTLSGGATGQWLCVFFWASAFITSYVCITRLYSDYAPDESQGWAMGIASSVFAFGFFIGGLTASLQSLLGLEWLLALGGLSMFSGGIAALFLPATANTNR